MMDLFGSLWNAGGSSQAAPTNMSQIKVPEQAMDLAGVTGAANSQLDYNNSQAPMGSMDGMWKGLMYGGASAIAGMNQGGKTSAAPVSSPERFSGARLPEQMNSEKLSAARLGQAQAFPQVAGLMNASG